MNDIIQVWKLKLDSCSQLLKQKAWQSDLVKEADKAAMDAKQQHETAEAQARDAKDRADAARSWGIEKAHDAAHAREAELAAGENAAAHAHAADCHSTQGP